MSVPEALHFVCTALPGPGNECVFVELETPDGASCRYGEWRQRTDGLVELVVPVLSQADAVDAQRLRADTAEAELARLRENHAALIEDRARFPDRPDFIGNMISAHIGNLKAGKKSAESYSRNWWNKLTVAEQRIAELKSLLQRVIDSSVLSFESDAPEDLEALEVDICAALNPNPEAESHE